MTRRAFLVLLAGGVLAGASPAAALEKQPKALSITTLQEIRGMLEKSMALQQKALQMLDDREGARKMVFDAYVPLRAAHARMVIHMSHRKVQFPTYDVAYKQIQDARDRLLGARSALAYPLTHVIKGETVEVITQKNIAECTRLINFVLVTTF